MPRNAALCCCTLLLAAWASLATAADPAADTAAGTAAMADTADCQPASEQVLMALNALRAGTFSCDGGTRAAAPALRWDAQLALSSRSYAEELARRDLLSHQGQVSRSLRERLRVAGYQRLRTAGENLAAGPERLDDALAQWLVSREHCENLMLPDFRDAGLACAVGPGRYERYWVLHLGRSAADKF